MRQLTTLTAAAALAALMAGPAAAQSTKTAVGTKGVQLLTSTNSFVPILEATIHIPQKKDIGVDVSVECGLMTETTVRSKGKKSGDAPESATAQASVRVRVAVYDETGTTELSGISVLPAADLTDDGLDNPTPVPVIYCKRTQTLTAALQGFIGNLSCFDPESGQFLPSCDNLFEEEIGLMLETLNANAFNFIVENLESGTYVIKADAEISDCATDPGACVVTEGSESHAAAFIGLGSMILDEVRLGNDVKIN